MSQTIDDAVHGPTRDAPRERHAEPAAPTAPATMLRALVRHPLGLIGLIGTLAVLIVGLAAPWIAPHEPFDLVAPPLSPPSRAHPMGSDALGHDLRSQVLHGARTSLTVAVIVAVCVLVIGLTVGLVAGSRHGWVDDVLMRGAEIVQIVPRFFLALVVAALFGPGVVRIALLLGLTSWPTLARMVRSQTQSLVEQDFVVPRTRWARGASGWSYASCCPTSCPSPSPTSASSSRRRCSWRPASASSGSEIPTRSRGGSSPATPALPAHGVVARRVPRRLHRVDGPLAQPAR